jgi:hypothetical protein
VIGDHEAVWRPDELAACIGHGARKVGHAELEPCRDDRYRTEELKNAFARGDVSACVAAHVEDKTVLREGGKDGRQSIDEIVNATRAKRPEA